MQKIASIIGKARNQAEKENYKGAFNTIKEIEKPLQCNVTDLLFISRIIQLGDDNSDWGLDRAEEFLQKAYEIDSENVDTLLDIGFFYSRVLDDEIKAKIFLYKALQKSICAGKDASEGLLELLTEGTQEQKDIVNIQEKFSDLRNLDI